MATETNPATDTVLIDLENMAWNGRRWPRFTTPSAVAIGVLVLAELIARVLAPGLPNPDWNFQQTDEKFAEMEALAASGTTVDTVFVGNSSVDIAFDAELFLQASGIDSFNAALNGSSMQQIEAWTTEVVVPLLQPETVIIGISSRDLNDASSSNREVFENYSTSRGRAKFLSEETLGQRVQARLASVSALVEISPFIRDPASLITQYNPDGPGTFIPPEEYSPRAIDITRTRERALNDFTVGGHEFAALERLLADLKAQGIIVVLMEMPFVEEDYLPLHPDGSEDYQEFSEMLAATTSAAGVPLIDFTQYDWTKAEFYDFNHVNSTGKVRINQLLAESLNAIG
jgi:hypothetical protein